jgi:hypothetical protein
VVERIMVPAIEHAAPAPDTRGPDALIAEYAAIRKAERGFVSHTGAGHIHTLIALNKLARKAMAPIAASDHIATPDEMQSAVAALGALRAYLGAKQ